MRVANFNVRASRSQWVVAVELGRIRRKYDPDVIAGQEGNNHRATLGRVAGYDLVLWDKCGTFLLVRQGASVAHAHKHRLGFIPWPYNGRLKPRRAICSAIVNGVRVVAGHMQAKVSLPLKGNLREKQYAFGIRRLVKYAKARPRYAAVYSFDWNLSPDARATFTPWWFAAQIGGQVVRAPHAGVTYAITRGLAATVHAVDHEVTGSDHPVVVFDVERN